jgi:hypothetical protein
MRADRSFVLLGDGNRRAVTAQPPLFRTLHIGFCARAIRVASESLVRRQFNN